MRVIIFVVFFLLGLVVAAQPALDGLEAVLKYKTALDSNRVVALNNLAYKYLAYVPAKAKKYSEEALELSRKLGFTKGEAIALINLGDYEFRQSNYAKSIEIETQLIKLTLDSLLLADELRNLGNAHTYGLKQYDEALRYHLQALGRSGEWNFFYVKSAGYRKLER